MSIRRILESGTIFRAIAKSDDVRAIKVRSIRPYNTKLLFYIYLYSINSWIQLILRLLKYQRITNRMTV